MTSSATRPQATRRTLVVWGSWLVFNAALLVVVLGGLADPSGARGSGSLAMDFRDTVWLPSKDFLAGNMPWDHVSYKQRYPGAQIFPVYTPWYLLPCLPLLLLPYPLAVALWLLCTTAVLCLLLTRSFDVLWPGLLDRRPEWFVLALALLAIPRPGRSGLTSANWAVLTACGAGLVLLSRAPRGRRDLLFSLFALVKPQVAIPFVVVELMSRRFRALATALAVGAVLSVPVLALAVARSGGVGAAVGHLTTTLAVGDEVNTGPTAPSSTRVDLAGNLQRLHAPDAVVTAGLVLSAVVLLGLAWVAIRRGGMLSAPALLAAGLAMYVVLPNQSYGYPVLVPGILALLRHFCDHRDRPDRWLDLLALAMLAVPLADTGPVMGWLGLDKVQAAAVTAGSLEALAVPLAVMVARQRGPREDRAALTPTGA